MFKSDAIVYGTMNIGYTVELYSFSKYIYQ